MQQLQQYQFQDYLSIKIKYKMGNVGIACESCKDAIEQTFNPYDSQQGNSLYPQQSYAIPIQEDQFQFSEKVNQILNNKNISSTQNVQLDSQGHYIEQPFQIVSFKLKYKGSWLKKKPHGQGDIKFSDGSCLRGWFKNGKCDEQQKHLFVFPDGAYYLGSIKANSFEGFGTYQSQDFIYEGQWKRNKSHGKGKQFFKGSKESRFEGQFYEGQKNGRGVYKWLDQNSVFQQYDGGFQNGYINGQGTLKKRNNQIIFGFFKTLPDKGKIITENAIIQKSKLFRVQVNLTNLVMEGQGKIIFSNGDILQATFINGQISGEGIGKIVNWNKNKQIKAVWKQGYPLLHYHQIKQEDLQPLVETINKCLKNSKNLGEALKELNKSNFANEHNYAFYINTKQNVNKYLQSKKSRSYVGFPLGEYEILIENTPKAFDQS